MCVEESTRRPLNPKTQTLIPNTDITWYAPLRVLVGVNEDVDQVEGDARDEVDQEPGAQVFLRVGVSSSWVVVRFHRERDPRNQPPPAQNPHHAYLHDDAAVEDDGAVLGHPAGEEVEDEVGDEEDVGDAVQHEEAHPVVHVKAAVRWWYGGVVVVGSWWVVIQSQKVRKMSSSLSSSSSSHLTR